MSAWLYLQAFVDLALGVGFVLLLAGRRRVRAAEAWQREVATLVDTLGELLVEVERVTAGGTSARAAEPAPDHPFGDLVDAPPAPVARPVSTAPAADEISPAFEPVPPATPATPEPPREAAPLVDAVLAFARDGLSAEDIARRVGRPVGEVMLTLGLRGPQPVTVEG